MYWLPRSLFEFVIRNLKFMMFHTRSAIENHQIIKMNVDSWYCVIENFLTSERMTFLFNIPYSAPGQFKMFGFRDKKGFEVSFIRLKAFMQNRTFIVHPDLCVGMLCVDVISCYIKLCQISGLNIIPIQMMRKWRAIFSIQLLLVTMIEYNFFSPLVVVYALVCDCFLFF